ncbi:carbohydrate esterase family 16 protein [Exidia glandulosa HHB12029]|uniref:Carbohydrate esterase family 16 protein n=1 Tax=Exidia glandulosa HHB12029 TaxID=1314781 RepID=A0A165H3S2_EXIGL|nr:carbohydrate esterase family 16 protein [Exidia glandulosa HHB12029]
MQPRYLPLLFLSLELLASAAARTLPQFKQLVTFGDSYSDVGAAAALGGTAWPVFAASDAGLTLHPFAKAGAACSNKITPLPSPPVLESQVPAWLEFKKHTPFSAQAQLETVYTLWIGTNDIGVHALLTGDAPGKTVVDTTACVVNWVKAMHRNGARNFIFQNMIPLQLTPLYSAGGHLNRYWNLQRNATEWSIMITELTTAGNALSTLMLKDLAHELPEARIALFDSHGLFLDMYKHPQLYLNGSAPLNVTGAIIECVYELNGGPVGGVCPPPVLGPAQDSSLWFDELHPSQQANRIVAREIANALRGDTRWATWIS